MATQHKGYWLTIVIGRCDLAKGSCFGKPSCTLGCSPEEVLSAVKWWQPVSQSPSSATPSQSMHPCLQSRLPFVTGSTWTCVHVKHTCIVQYTCSHCIFWCSYIGCAVVKAWEKRAQYYYLQSCLTSEVELVTVSEASTRPPCCLSYTCMVQSNAPYALCICEGTSFLSLTWQLVSNMSNFTGSAENMHLKDVQQMHCVLSTFCWLKRILLIVVYVHQMCVCLFWKHYCRRFSGVCLMHHLGFISGELCTTWNLRQHWSFSHSCLCDDIPS